MEHTAYSVMLAKIKAYRLTKDIMAAALQPHNVTLMEWLALGALQQCGQGGLSHSELALQLNVSKPYISKLTDQLLAKNLLQEAEKANDKRVHKLKLSEEGKELVETTEPVVRQALREWLSPLDRTQVETYIQIVMRVAHDL